MSSAFYLQQLVPGRREHKCPTCTTCDCCTSFRQRHVVPAWHSIRRILEPSIAFHDKCFDHVSHPASVTQHTMAGLKDVHRQNKQHEQIVSYVFDYIDNNNNTTTTNKNNNSVTRDVTATITVAATSWQLLQLAPPLPPKHWWPTRYFSYVPTYFSCNYSAFYRSHFFKFFLPHRWQHRKPSEAHL